MGSGTCRGTADVPCQCLPFAEQFWALLLDLLGAFLSFPDSAFAVGKGEAWLRRVNTSSASC